MHLRAQVKNNFTAILQLQGTQLLLISTGVELISRLRVPASAQRHAYCQQQSSRQRQH